MTIVRQEFHLLLVLLLDERYDSIRPILMECHVSVMSINFADMTQEPERRGSIMECERSVITM